MSRGAFGVGHRLNGGLIVSEDYAPPGGVGLCVDRRVRSGMPAPFPLSSAAYTVEVVDVPMYSILFARIPWIASIGATTAALTWPSMPLSSVCKRIA